MYYLTFNISLYITDENNKDYALHCQSLLLFIARVLLTKNLFLFFLSFNLKWVGYVFQIMVKMSAFSSFFMGLFVCILLAFLSGRVKRVQLPRVGGLCLQRFVQIITIRNINQLPTTLGIILPAFYAEINQSVFELQL